MNSQELTIIKCRLYLALCRKEVKRLTDAETEQLFSLAQDTDVQKLLDIGRAITREEFNGMLELFRR